MKWLGMVSMSILNFSVDTLLYINIGVLIAVDVFSANKVITTTGKYDVMSSNLNYFIMVLCMDLSRQ